MALRQYRKFELQLQQELDISPSPQTQELLHEILRQQNIPGITAEFTAPNRKSPTLPFIGRDDLLNSLSLISQDVLSEHGTTILLQGEGGIGKSRSISELISKLATASPLWIVLRGACSPFDNALSHGPFLDALQNGKLGDLADLLVEFDFSETDARGRFSWKILQTIRSLSQSAPLMLVIEDLQWANSSTLNLFGFLSTHILQSPVMLCGTVQHAEAIPALRRLITLERPRGNFMCFRLPH